MKVVIFAGGLGTRLHEETVIKPKPMVEIGGKPILWHIMKIYSEQGFNEFIICLGYKGYYIKEWFNNYYLHNSDVTIDMAKNTTELHANRSEKWKVTLVDTGDETLTAGRLKRIQPYVGNETFMATYGDGVADVDIKKLVDFHKKHKKIATVTAIIPEGKFGAMIVNDEYNVISFAEKKDNKNRINGGYFVFEPGIFDYLKGGDTMALERAPLETLSKDGELKAYYHDGFWQPMDTLREKNILEDLWKTGKAPWKLWK